MGHTEQFRRQYRDELGGLLDGCANDDPAAWRRLLDAVRQLALDLARRQYRLTNEEAEDVAQVVQLRVSSRLGQLREPSAFPLWARRLIHHAALDAIRQRRPVSSLDAGVGEDEEAMELPDTTDSYETVLLRADLNRALSRLPDRYREPICMHLLQGLPQDEIGRRLGRPRSTVATQVERGLQRLRRSLAGMPMASA